MSLATTRFPVLLATLAALGVASLTAATLTTAAPAGANPGAASAYPGTVRTGDGAVRVRSGPSTSATQLGTLASGTAVSIACQVSGQQVAGTVRATNLWDRLASGGYVSHAYVETGAAIPACAAAVTPGTEPVGSMTNAEFIAASVAPAQQAQREYSVPASVTIAQAILESGWGRSGLASQSRNFFGIKCFNGSPGPIAIGCRDWSTYECLPTCAPTTASFRVYASATDSFRDHAVFLTTNSRYRPAFSYTHDANAFLYHIWKAGYATSPTYYDNVTAVMRQHNLYQYDGAPPVTSRASLSGDARAEIVHIDAAGTVRGFHNVNGLAGLPYPQPAVTVGIGFDPARTRFADLDGDGKSEIVHIEPGGTVRAFRNVNGLSTPTFPQASVVVAEGADPAGTRFGDIDGDGRAELIIIDAGGTVRALRNVNGLSAPTYPQPATVVGVGFDRARTLFADVDGDRKDEIVLIDAAGTVRAFRNVNGLTGFPYPQPAAVIGAGFDAARTRFGDIDGDGKAEIVLVDASNTVRAFRNVNGLTGFPYPQPGVAIGFGFEPARTFFA
jgi:flagellar protein FlgJ